MNAQTGLTTRIARWAKGISSAEEEGQVSADQSPREASKAGFSREVDRRRELYNDIGSFLFAHDLDLTVVNFGLALDYLSGNDHQIEKAVRAILSEKGQLTNGVVEQIVAERHSGEMTAENLGQMLATVEQNLDKFTTLASESTASASDYGEALQAKVKDMDGKAAPDQVVSALIGLTRSMVEKSRQIEAEMRESQKKTQALQKNLEQARKAAEQDHLTGLPNRRAFEARLNEEATLAKANGEALSVAFCDIDFFKRINDGYGHDAGDVVLKEFAARFKRNTRGVDLACRLGGEEFVIVMPETDLARAYQVGERLRAYIAAEMFQVSSEKRIRVTASVGLATLERSDDTAETLFKRADNALYAAKRRGRNRVVSDAA